MESASINAERREAEQSLVGQWLSDMAIDEAADLATNAVVSNPDATAIVRELVAKAMREIRDNYNP